MIPKLNQNKILFIPTSLFLMLLFIRPFISEMAFPMVDNYIRIAILSIFSICLLTSKEFRVTTTSLSKPLILYITAGIISIFNSINLRSSLYEIYQLIPLLCIFMFTSNLKEKQFVKLIVIIAASALLLSIYGIYQYFLGFEHTKEYLSLYFKNIMEASYAREILITRRAIATFFSPNMFASYLATVIPLCVGLSVSTVLDKKTRFFCRLSVIFMLISLLLTKSLAGWISLSAGLVIFFIFFNRRVPRRLILILGILILIMPLFILLMRYDMFINFANQQNTISQRLSFWRSSLEIIKDFPWQGVGIGNFSNIYPKYKELIANETRFAHNIFLHTWVELGLLGTLSLILLLFTFIRITLKAERNSLNIAAIISCYTFIINNLLDFSFFIPQVSFILWINLGCITQKSDTLISSSTRNKKLAVILFILPAIYLNIISLIAFSYFQKGDYKKAVAIESFNDLYHAAAKDYHKAIELNPYSPFYHKELALLYLQKNMLDKAIAEFKKASDLYPENIFLHQYLLDLYKKVGDDKKADLEYKKLQEFQSKYSGYYIR